MAHKVKLSTRPSNWKSLAPAPLPNTPFFAGQASLPRLPIPELLQTLERLKESLKPLAENDKEYQEAVAKIDSFGKGKGRELHERLLAHSKSRENWLEEWWDDYAYLACRDSLVVNVSYYFGFDRQPEHLPQTPAARAAGLVRAAMIFRQQLKQGVLSPDGDKQGPWCMDTYRWMFDCCRVPGPNGLDWNITHAQEGDTGDAGHIVVFRKNRPWRLDVTSEGKILSFGDLEQQFQHVYDETTQTYPGVGVLTAGNRDVWARDYAGLVADPVNAEIIHSIHSAAFCVSLETSMPPDDIALARALWLGDIINDVPEGLQNRWADKPVQFIVFDNSKAGVVGEHSVMDGSQPTRFYDDILEMIYSPSFDLGTPSSSVHIPTPMDWLLSQNLASAMTSAEQAAAELISNQVLNMHNTTYGKAAIKKFGLSPDAWAQMIIQLAYCRLTGSSRRVGTYEPAMARKFYKGRTEAVRVVTTASDTWVTAMDDSNTSDAERRRLLGVAATTHVARVQGAKSGMGVDRHMLGLKLTLQQGEELPEIFRDNLVKRGGYWTLCTATVFSKHFLFQGWGAVVPDGYGIPYITGFNDHLQFTVTSCKDLPNERFCNEIAKAAIDLYKLCANVGKTP